MTKQDMCMWPIVFVIKIGWTAATSFRIMKQLTQLSRSDVLPKPILEVNPANTHYRWY